MPPSTSRQAEEAPRFQTHLWYLEAFDLSATFTHGRKPYTSHDATLRGIGATVRVAPSCAHLNRRADADVAQVERSLTNAWGTELLLTFTRDVATEDELLRLTNNWSIVQAYYVGYHAMQALLVASGQARPTTHAGTQRQYASFWINQARDLRPWSLAVDSNGPVNSPPGHTPDLGVQPWKTVNESNCWDIAFKAIDTTRRSSVSDALSDRRRREQAQRRKAWGEDEAGRLKLGRRPRREPIVPLPILTAAQKLEVATKVRPFTLLDYLYRLRIRTNYEDADVFAVGPASQQDSENLQRHLRNLVSGRLLAHELHICQLLGRPAMDRLIRRWLQDHIPSGRMHGLARRVDLILA